MTLIVASVERPETRILINSLLSPIILSVANSPLSKLPTSVLSFTYNSNADFALTVFCAAL